MAEGREATRSRASGSPMPGECRSTNGPARRRTPVTRPPDRWGPRKELNETHQKAEDARGKGSTGRDSGFALARPVLSWQDPRTSSRAICTVMPQIQHGLAPGEYLRFRERYLPAHPKIIFVLESPPRSGLYFYKPGAVSEPLFSAMMKDVLEIKPKTKEEGLVEFASRGFLLIDATYKPVNHPHLSQKARNTLILDDFPLLIGVTSRKGPLR